MIFMAISIENLIAGSGAHKQMELRKLKEGLSKHQNDTDACKIHA
jgi:hypothetical protein